MTTTKNDKLEPVLTLNELAAYLKVSKATIYRWNSTGRGPKGKKIGRYVRYLQADVTEWIKHAQPSG